MAAALSSPLIASILWRTVCHPALILVKALSFLGRTKPE
jgi:hypothetical protein